MNRQTTIAVTTALIIGLCGGGVGTYSWLRTPERPNDPTANAPHDDEHEDEGSGVHAEDEADQESIVHLTPEQMAESGLELATAGPGPLITGLSLPGKVTFNGDRIAHIVPRAPGIVREVLKGVGDTVRAGEVMAWIESAELGDAKVSFLAKWAEVGCCAIDLTRAREVHDNTLALLQDLKSAPSLKELRETNAVMGDNRSALISAYAELVFAKAAYEREQSLLAESVSSETDYQEAEAAYKKADADYATTRDSTEFKVRRGLLEAEQTQRTLEMELLGAERRLHVLGLTAEEISHLQLLAGKQTSSEGTKAVCNDPSCKDCANGGAAGAKVAAAPRAVNERLAWYPLRAPFDGTVIEKHLTLGEKHGDDSDVFTIADLSSVWVDVNVYRKDLAYVKVGRSARISAGEGATSATGTISFVAPVVNEKTRTAVARVVLPNPQGAWQPGVFVKAELSVGGGSASVVIPRTAIQRVSGDTVVFIQTDDGFTPEPVSLGRRNTTHAEVLSGLQSGQRYVAEGAFELKAKIVTSGLGSHAGHGH